MRGRDLRVLVLSALAAFATLPAEAAQILWEFEGFVASISPDSDASGPSLGSRFAGRIQFTDQPAGETVFMSAGATRSFSWRDVRVGIQLVVGEEDFSAIGTEETFQAAVLDDQYSTIFPGHTGPLDALRFVAIQDPYASVFGSMGYRRNLVLDLVDFDERIFDDTSLPLAPPSLASLELKTLSVSLSLPHQTVRFQGEIDKIVLIPEPSTFYLLVSGLLAFAVSRGHRSPALTPSDARSANRRCGPAPPPDRSDLVASSRP